MVERAVLSDYEELLAFEERVFHVRFRGKVPKLYCDPAVCANAHCVVKEDGRIVAAIAAPVVNTGIFLLGCLLFFMDIITEEFDDEGLGLALNNRMRKAASKE